MKRCHNCDSDNPDYVIVCLNCGLELEDNSENTDNNKEEVSDEQCNCGIKSFGVDPTEYSYYDYIKTHEIDSPGLSDKQDFWQRRTTKQKHIIYASIIIILLATIPLFYTAINDYQKDEDFYDIMGEISNNEMNSFQQLNQLGNASATDENFDQARIIIENVSKTLDNDTKRLEELNRSGYNENYTELIDYSYQVILNQKNVMDSLNDMVLIADELKENKITLIEAQARLESDKQNMTACINEAMVAKDRIDKFAQNHPDIESKFVSKGFTLRSTQTG
ncbi:MAG: hypothetical protein BZ136_00970 [Methanosphaera sp. rholeuAM74]|nr:MAG: hypothetical protein BZ136_00970 [Methanosphaera sp. rholeuAM74]